VKRAARVPSVVRVEVVRVVRAAVGLCVVVAAAVACATPSDYTPQIHVAPGAAARSLWIASKRPAPAADEEDAGEAGEEAEGEVPEDVGPAGGDAGAAVPAADAGHPAGDRDD
jgi:hypothetical protein